MANPYSDERYQLARLMRGQRGVGGTYVPPRTRPSGTAVSLGRAANDLAAANPALRAQIEAIANRGETAKAPSGVMGAVLGNPLTKTALGALGTLAIPGRVVVSGAREIYDALDEDPNTKASFSDFGRQVKDAKFGFGTAFAKTGNKWLDRMIGFVGDVALDPLTYMTFGVGKFAGYAGRLELASSVLKHTGDARLANLVQRYGRSAIKNQEVLQAVGANRHGLYLLGKRVKVGVNQQGWRIPGTGTIGNLGDSALAKLRVAGSKTKAGQWVQKMTLPADGLAARRAMLAGTVGDDAASALIAYFSASPVARTAAGEALQREKQLTRQFVESEGRQGLDGYKTTIYDYLENPELLSDASPELQRAAAEWRDYFAWYEKQVDDAYKAADPSANPPVVEHYYPRMQTDEAIAYRQNPANRHSRALNEIWSRDPLEGGRNFKSRSLREGDDWFGHTLTAEDLKSTKRLNELAREGGFVGDFFETDILRVADRYVDEFAKEIGIMARHKHLVDGGFWKRAEAVTVGGDMVDQQLVDSIKKQVKSLDDDLANAVKEVNEAYLGAGKAVTDYAASLRKQIDELTNGPMEQIAEAERAIDDILSNSLTVSADKLQVVADVLGQAKKKLAALYGFEVRNGKLYNASTGQLVDNPGETVSGLYAVINDAEIKAGRAVNARNWQELKGTLTREQLEAAQKKTVQELRVMSEELKEVQRTMNNVAEFGNQIEEAISAIVNGTDVGDVMPSVENVLGIMGANIKGMADTTVAKNMRKALGVTGRTADEIDALLKSDPIIGPLQSASRVNTSTIKKMTIKDFFNKLPRMFNAEMSLHGDLSIQDLREMGIWAIMNDSFMFGGNLPPALKQVHETLVAKLAAADVSQAITEQLVKEESQAGRLTAAKILSSEVKPHVDRTIDIQEQLDKLDKLFGNKKLIAALEREAVENGDKTINPAFVANYPEFEYILNRRNRSYVYVDENGREVYASSDVYDELQNLMEDVGYNVNPPGMRADNPNYAKPIKDVASTVDKKLTYGEFYTSLKQERELLMRELDEGVVKTGQGVSERTYTRRELLAKWNSYQSKLDELNAWRSNVAEATARERAAMDFDFDGIQKQINELPAGSTQRAQLQGQLDKQNELAKSRVERRLEIEAQKAGKRTYGQIVGELRDMGAGASLLKSDWFVGGQIIHNQLAESIVEYMMVSQVVTRWKATQAMMASNGIVPSEDTMRAIMNLVGSKFLPSIDSQIDATRRSWVIVKNLDEQVAAALRNQASTGKTANDVFRDVMGSLSDEDKSIVMRALGNRLGWEGDPYTLVRKRRNVGNGLTGKAHTEAMNAFYEESVKPWFVSAFPDVTPTKTAMRNALRDATGGTARKGARKSLITPWAPDADAATIKRFFEDIIGESSISGVRSSQRIATFSVGVTGGRNIGGEVYTLNKNFNQINTKLRRLEQTRQRFQGMLLPDADLRIFLSDPSAVQKTPTFYASMLRWEADRLQAELAARGAIAGTIEDVQSEINVLQDLFSENAAAAEALQRGEIPDVVKNEINAAIAKSKKIAEGKAPKGAVLSDREEQLIAVGPTVRERAAKGEIRAAGRAPAAVNTERSVREYNELLTSAEYAAATQNSELNQVLDQLAVYDLWKYTDGFSFSQSSVDDITGETVATEVFATLNGKRIIFSKDEWDSLYVAVDAAASRSKGVQERALRKSWSASGIGSEKEWNNLVELSKSKGPEAVAAKRRVDEIIRNANDIADIDAREAAHIRAREGINAQINEQRNYLRQVSSKIEKGELALQERQSALEVTMRRKESALAGARSQAEKSRLEKMYDTNISRLEREIDIIKNDRSNGLAFYRSQAEITRGVIDDLTAKRATYDPRVQAAALKKISALVFGTSESPAVLAVKSDGSTGSTLERFLLGELGFQRNLAKNNVTPDTPGVTMGKTLGKDRNALWEELINDIDPGLVNSDPAKYQELIDKAWMQADRLSRDFTYNVKEVVDSLTRNADASFARRKNLAAAWDAHSSKQVLARAQKMANEVMVARYIEHTSDVARLRAELDVVMRRLEVHQQRYADATTAVDRRVQRAGEYIDRAQERIEQVSPEKAGDVGAVRGLIDSTADETSPDALRAAAENLEDIGRPAGPFTDDIATNATLEEKLLQAETLDQQISDKQDELSSLLGQLDEWEGTVSTPTLADNGIWVTHDWTVQSAKDINGKKLMGQRQVLLEQAELEVKYSMKKYESAEALIGAIRDVQSKHRAEIIVNYGGPDEFWRVVNERFALASSLREQLNRIERVMLAMPSKEAGAILKKVAKKNLNDDAVREALTQYRQWVERSRPALNDLLRNPDDPVAKAFAAAAVADARLLDLQLSHSQRIFNLAVAEVPVYRASVVQPFADGYTRAAEESGMYQGMKTLRSEGLPGLYGNKEAVDLLKNIDRIREPGVVEDMARFMRGYTGFFRSYATLSPGFHVRNTISNTFMMFAAGADFKNLREGFRMWRLMDDHFSNGGTLQSFIATLPEAQREFAYKAGKIMLGMGSSKVDDALVDFTRTGSLLRSNRLLDLSRRAGGNVEGSARFMLAWDSLMKGLDENQSFNRTRRYLIDYQEKTLLDQQMRDIVPFWTWMSRNLPLQIINRWTNPKAYLMYQHAYDNFNQDGELTPGYIRNKMGINLGNGVIVNPDLPFTGVNEQVASFASPQKLMSNINPGLRVPLEMLANKKFFTGTEFKDSFVELSGKNALLLPILAATGQVQYNSQGKPMVSEKAMYAVQNLVPFLGQAERLMPSTERGQERLGNSALSYLGIPVQNMTEGMEDSERLRRLAALRQLEQQRKALG